MCRFGLPTFLIISLIAGTLASGNIAPLLRGNLQTGTPLPEQTAEVSVLDEHLNISIAPDPQAYLSMPVANVTAEYNIRNETEADRVFDIAFPVSGSFAPMAREFQDPSEYDNHKFGYQVSLDGAAVAASERPILIPPTTREPGPYGGWDERLDTKLSQSMAKWIGGVPGLNELLIHYSEIAPSASDRHFASHELETAADTILGRRGLTYYLSRYMSARAEKKPIDSQTLAELAAEAEPTLRTQVGDSYSSKLLAARLSDEQVEQYCKMIDAWINQYPALKEKLAAVSAEDAKSKIAEDFLQATIAEKLRSSTKVDGALRQQMLDYFRSAYNYQAAYMTGKPNGEFEFPKRAEKVPRHSPGIWLGAQIDPAIEADRVDAIRRADEILDKYGFDTSFLSPLTGRGYQKRFGWRDDSTWTLLNFVPPQARDRDRVNNQPAVASRARSSARLIRFSIPLKSKQTHQLKVTYSALTEVDELAASRNYYRQIVHFRYILNTAKYWKSFGPVAITISMPHNGLAVIEPAPDSENVSDDGNTTVYRTALKSIDHNLRIAWLPATDKGHSTQFYVRKEDALELERLLAAPGLNSQVRRVLETIREITKTGSFPTTVPVGKAQGEN